MAAGECRRHRRGGRPRKGVRAVFSHVSMDRLLEQRKESDEEFRKQVAGRPLRSSVKDLTDAELLARLRGFDIDLDRPSLGELCDRHLSAEEIARPLLKRYESKAGRTHLEGDWVWICLTELWQRWFPDKPSFEGLDDKMQAG